jgi:hypothetical protein
MQRAWGTGKIHTKILVGKPEGKKSLENLDVYGRAILE